MQRQQWQGGSGGTVKISGGTVTAAGDMAAGIGGGDINCSSGSSGTTTITGGSVNASSIQPNVYDKSNPPNQEYLVTISGLPCTVGVSYTVNAGSSVSCSTDTNG
ncbi:hypothetical protein [Desulfosporosinus sp. FKB]|uniref:hypothetical protein n=1 Tax=Desulfosporosinus sp. FKB TaxID=1969835 RepID=UPI001124DF70|nr:hypothetical protein [Desulfosporosinus sp. FKB]